MSGQSTYAARMNWAQTLRLLSSLVIWPLIWGASTASASPPEEAWKHLPGVWEGIATAKGDDETWHEYVAFEFSADGSMKMANAREPEAVKGTWVVEDDGLRLRIPERPSAMLDKLQITEERLVARLGYGQGQAVQIELQPSKSLPKPKPLTDKAVISAGDITFDGVQLGASMLNFYRRRLYAAPCDEDSLRKERLRVIVYAATPCRHRQFSENTSFIVFTDLDEKSLKNQSVRTVAWLGGTYFNTRSNFPLALGTGVRGAAGRKKLAKRLGQRVERTMTLKRYTTLQVTTLTGAIHLIDDGKVLVGIVLGPMPSTTDNELWSGVMQMWEKYTAPRKR